MFLIKQNAYASELSAQSQTAVNYIQMQKTNEAINLINGLNSKEKREIIKWIDENPDKVIPLYYIIFADEIFQTDKEKAALWYSIGRLRAIQDVKMCKDTSAASQITVYAMIAPNTSDYIIKQGNAYILQMLEKAVAFDEAHATRQNPIWACYHGMQAFKGKPETLPMSEYKKIQKETNEKFLSSMRTKAKTN